MVVALPGPVRPKHQLPAEPERTCNLTPCRRRARLFHRPLLVASNYNIGLLILPWEPWECVYRFRAKISLLKTPIAAMRALKTGQTSCF